MTLSFEVLPEKLITGVYKESVRLFGEFISQKMFELPNRTEGASDFTVNSEESMQEFLNMLVDSDWDNIKDLELTHADLFLTPNIILDLIKSNEVLELEKTNKDEGKLQYNLLITSGYTTGTRLVIRFDIMNGSVCHIDKYELVNPI